MSSAVINYLKTKNKQMLLDAASDLSKASSFTSRADYETLILNHFGILQGLEECEIAQANAYKNDGVLNYDYDKYTKSIDTLIGKGSFKAILSKIEAVVDSNPDMAIGYLNDCVNNPNADLGEVYYWLGHAYYVRGEGDTERVFKYYQYAADEFKNEKAQYAMSEFYGSGSTFCKKDVKKAIKYCQDSANGGYAEALLEIGLNYVDNDTFGYSRNHELALDYITRAAKAGSKKGMLFLGVMYLDGYIANQNIDLAQKWLEDAMFEGMLSAYAQLGKLHYLKGEYEKAYDYFKTAVLDYGDITSGHCFIDMLINGKGCDVDIPFAIQVTEKMLDKDEVNTADLKFVAECYETGNGVPKNIDKAIAYYKCLANLGSCYLMKIGDLICSKESTVKDRECIRYYETAAKEGESEAYYKLALYYAGIKNYDRALDYFIDSYNNGYVDCGVMIGRIYEAGTTTIQKDIKIAVEWYERAAKEGSEKAKEELKSIKKTIFGYKRITNNG